MQHQCEKVIATVCLAIASFWCSISAKKLLLQLNGTGFQQMVYKCKMHYSFLTDCKLTSKSRMQTCISMSARKRGLNAINKCKGSGNKSKCLTIHQRILQLIMIQNKCRAGICSLNNSCLTLGMYREAEATR